MFVLKLSVIQKRFYTIETIRGIRISPLAEIPPLFMIGWNRIF